MLISEQWFIVTRSRRLFLSILQTVISLLFTMGQALVDVRSFKWFSNDPVDLIEPVTLTVLHHRSINETIKIWKNLSRPITIFDTLKVFTFHEINGIEFRGKYSIL